MDSEISFIVNVLFGATGLAYFVYGRRQKMIVPLVCGIGLMGYPYFVSNTILLVLIGVVLLVLPFVIKY